MQKTVPPAMRRLAAAFALAIGITHIGSRAAAAQARDSSRTDSTRAQRMERVMISAVRGAGAAPISQKTITKAEIEPRYFGQDVPLVLQGAAPSLTAYAETGNYWGYSYIRLRGIDQSRINLTLDGIPLNDPEDQVLYFADFPDLANSLNSVQVQRGVGTSSNGTAAYAGSINMETVSLAGARRGGNVQLERGSFGSTRLSGEVQSGLLPSRFAFYGRLSSLRTEGYRYHSGVEGKSAFLSAGYFGDRDIVKATVTTGTMMDTMAYYAVAKSDLDTNRRINPLTPAERDGFTERLAALAYTRLLGASSSITTTAYRISNGGDYDVLIDSLWNFNLKAAWFGVTSDWSYRRNGLQLDIGANGNTYARDHAAYQRPAITVPLYFNTGHKREASAFTKLAYTTGRATWFGDLQARRASFRYTPDVNAGIGERSIDWTFVNPKAGVSYAASAAWTLNASYGKNSREPARGDMFAGLDNLDSASAPFVGDLSRVKPESVRDLEAGVAYRSRRLSAAANLYSMDFRNEIAPIGALSELGAALRQNVASSYRRGVEADVTWYATDRLKLLGTASASRNRIREYVDSTGDAPVKYTDVSPLLTPTFQSFARAELAATRSLMVAVESRYQNEAFLRNNGDKRFVLPSYNNIDASASWRFGRGELVGRVNNLTDTKKYGSGYEYAGEPNYYVLAPRNFFVTVKVEF